MEHLLIAGIVGIILIAILIWLIFRRKNLDPILNLSVEFIPKEASLGQTVNFILHSRPERTLKAKSVEGHLVCRRYTHKGIKWLDNYDMPGISAGEITSMLVFDFGEGLMFMEGTDSCYAGYIPIPMDGFATQIEGNLQVRWVVTVRVHVEGYSPAMVRQELFVGKSHPMAVKKENGEISTEFSEQTHDTYRPKKIPRRENVIMMVQGDTCQGANGGFEDKTRFSFLELEEERKDIKKNL